MSLYKPEHGRIDSLFCYPESFLLIVGIVASLFTPIYAKDNVTFTYHHTFKFHYELPKTIQTSLKDQFSEYYIDEGGSNTDLLDFYTNKRPGRYYYRNDKGEHIPENCCETTNLHFLGMGDFNGDAYEDVVVLLTHRQNRKKRLVYFEKGEKGYDPVSVPVNIERPYLKVHTQRVPTEILTAAGKGYASSPHAPHRVTVSTDYVSFYYSLVIYNGDKYQQVFTSD